MITLKIASSDYIEQTIELFESMRSSTIASGYTLDEVEGWSPKNRPVSSVFLSFLIDNRNAAPSKDLISKVNQVLVRSGLKGKYVLDQNYHTEDELGLTVDFSKYMQKNPQ